MILIPAEFNGIRVTAVGTAAFQGISRVKRIIIPQGVRTIDDWAFSYMDGLEYVQLPTTLTELGANSFSGTGALGQIRLPEGIHEIGTAAFDMNGNTMICAAEGSGTAVMLHEMGYQVLPEDQCAEDSVMTALWGESDASGTCDCVCSGAAAGGVSGPAGTAYSDYQIIRVPNGVNSLTADLLDNSKEKLLLIVPSSVLTISEEILNGHDIILVGESGSAAEDFARGHDIRFFVIVKAWLDLS